MAECGAKQEKIKSWKERITQLCDLPCIPSTINTSKKSSMACSEGKPLPHSPAPCQALISPLSWVISGALGISGGSPHQRATTRQDQRAQHSQPSLQGDESLVVLLEPCSSLDADPRVSFIRGMSCNSNNLGTFCFLPSTGRHEAVRSTRPRVRAESSSWLCLILISALSRGQRSTWRGALGVWSIPAWLGGCSWE